MSSIPKCRLCAKDISNPPLINLAPFPKAAQFFPTPEEFATDHGIDLDVYQCDGCGLTQLAIEPVDYYKEVITAASLSEKARTARLAEMKSFVEEFDLTGKQAIEIGCAKGDMLDIITDAGLKATGLEFSKTSVEHASDKGRHVVCGYINDFTPTQKFDVFFSFNYLEHQPSPVDFVRSITRITTDDAIGYVTVPNLNYLLDSKCLYEFVADHLVYFTQQTLKLAFENNGFDVIRCMLINNDNDILAIVKKRPLLNIKDYVTEVDRLKSDLNVLIDRYVENGQQIAVWGAGHRTLALLAISKIDKISCIVDSALFKQGCYSPVTFNKIISPQKFEESDIDAVIIMVPGIYPQEVLKTVRNFNRPVTAYMLEGNHLVQAKE